MCIRDSLWDAANQLWAGAGLKQSEYSEPVLGLIFLRFAEVRFSAQRAKLEQTSSSSRRGSRLDEPAAYHADGILYLPAASRFDHLLNLPEGTNIGQTVNDAMRAIERDNPHMAGVLPKGYQIFDSRLLAELIKTVSTIPATLEGDAFGKIYEYFLGTFAMSEGQKGGEFYTPPSIVSLLVEVLSPFHGRILDLACGSVGSLPASRLCGMRFAENDRAIAHGVVQFQGQDKWARRQRPFGLAPRARRVRLRGQQPKQSNATSPGVVAGEQGLEFADDLLGSGFRDQVPFSSTQASARFGRATFPH